jgi:PAS domain S-box-containing protein
MHSRDTAASALEDSEERYRAVVAALEEGIVIHEADGAVASCNASACRIFGLSEEEVLGRTWLDPRWRLVHESGAPFPPEEHPAAVTLRTGEPRSQVVLGLDRPDGGRRWISINSRPLVRPGGGAPYAAVLSFSDITARREAEEERGRIGEAQVKLQQLISRSALEWRLTFDALGSPLLLLELDGRIIRLNEAARALAGIPFEDAVHKPLAALGGEPPWPAVQALAERVIATAEGATTQARERQGRAWDVAVNPVAGPGGERWLVVVLLDITDLVKLQESLRRSETMSAMGALVAGVAHEVRNPLFGISATLDAFESRFKSRTEYRRYFDVLKERVHRLSELMQQLLDYGKPLRLAPSAEAPGEVMRAAAAGCSPLAAKARVEIVEEPVADLPSLEMDRNRVVQVFQNLLENAIQHSPPGSRVVFRAEGTGEGVRFAVEDSGSGFRAEDLDRIFEPFFTRRRGGTGLGLSIVQRIVEQHGGEVAASNRPDGGAVMSVTLPLHPRQVPYSTGF